MASLHRQLQGQLEPAGVEVVRTRLRRLAYAPKIAADTLRRQQAEAVVAAPTRIVAGAVGMVELALNRLSEQQWIQTLRSTSPAAIKIIGTPTTAKFRRTSRRHRAPEAVEPEGFDDFGTFAFEQEIGHGPTRRRRQGDP